MIPLPGVESSVMTYSKNRLSEPTERRFDFGLVFYTADVGTQGGEFFDETLVAALHIVDVLHTSGTLSSQAGNNQSCTGTKVFGTDGRATQALHTADSGGFAVDLDFGAHVLQLGAIAEEASLVNTLGQAAGSVAQGTVLCVDNGRV